jgi:hypothetical protein
MTTIIAITSIIAGSTLLFMSIPALLGFGTAGIAAGSTAAVIQSGIGNVAAGSIFAFLTSLGMKGAFLATSAGGILSTAFGTVLAFFA